MSAGQIHDLGYQRYVGSRRGVGTRWAVIMRQQIATAWTGWWRFKLWLIAAAVVTAVHGAVLYFLHGKVYGAVGGLPGEVIRFADGLIPKATGWYCKVGFVVSLAITAPQVAGDVESGAFTFYFARSLRPIDYVLGKLAGLGVLLALVMAAGPVLLGGLRLGLSDHLAQAVALSPILGKELAVGALGTLVYAAVPLGFSALIGSRRHATALWAAYYLVVGWIALGVGYLVDPALAALDLAASLQAISLHLFGLHAASTLPEPSTSAALISIGAHVAIALALVAWRVRRAQETGVGGAG